MAREFVRGGERERRDRSCPRAGTVGQSKGNDYGKMASIPSGYRRWCFIERMADRNVEVSQMSITKTEYCMHGQHFVEAEKITWLYPVLCGRRRICEDCKNKVEESRIANKTLTINNKRI